MSAGPEKPSSPEKFEKPKPPSQPRPTPERVKANQLEAAEENLLATVEAFLPGFSSKEVDQFYLQILEGIPEDSAEVEKLDDLLNSYPSLNEKGLQQVRISFSKGNLNELVDLIQKNYKILDLSLTNSAYERIEEAAAALRPLVVIHNARNHKDWSVVAVDSYETFYEYRAPISSSKEPRGQSAEEAKEETSSLVSEGTHSELEKIKEEIKAEAVGEGGPSDVSLKDTPKDEANDEKESVPMRPFNSAD